MFIDLYCIAHGTPYKCFRLFLCCSDSCDVQYMLHRTPLIFSIVCLRLNATISLSNWTSSMASLAHINKYNIILLSIMKELSIREKEIKRVKLKTKLNETIWHKTIRESHHNAKKIMELERKIVLKVVLQTLFNIGNLWTKKLSYGKVDAVTFN